jgi:hypothetical protein
MGYVSPRRCRVNSIQLDVFMMKHIWDNRKRPMLYTMDANHIIHTDEFWQFPYMYIPNLWNASEILVLHIMPSMYTRNWINNAQLMFIFRYGNVLLAHFYFAVKVLHETLGM